jgi:hypothetical protein
MFTLDGVIKGKRFFSSPNIQSGSVAHTASYSMGIGAEICTLLGNYAA